MSKLMKISLIGTLIEVLITITLLTLILTGVLKCSLWVATILPLIAVAVDLTACVVNAFKIARYNKRVSKMWDE